MWKCVGRGTSQKRLFFLQSFKVDIVANPQLSLGIPGAVVVLKVRGGWQISMMVPQPAMSNAASRQLWNLWSQKLTNLILFHLFEYFQATVDVTCNS